MRLPASHRAGDTLEWTEEPAYSVTSDDWTLAVYFRKGASGVTANGVARSDGGWDLSLTATQTAAMAVGRWDWQAVAANGAARTTLDTGSLSILASLVYTGTPASFDGRTEAEVELAEVRAAIRAIVSGGVSQYTIGSRSATKMDLGKLMQRESQLKAIVAREKAAARVASGLGDPRNVFVRFG